MIHQEADGKREAGGWGADWAEAGLWYVTVQWRRRNRRAIFGPERLTSPLISRSDIRLAPSPDPPSQPQPGFIRPPFHPGEPFPDRGWDGVQPAEHRRLHVWDQLKQEPLRSPNTHRRSHTSHQLFGKHTFFLSSRRSTEMLHGEFLFGSPTERKKSLRFGVLNQWLFSSFVFDANEPRPADSSPFQTQHHIPTFTASTDRPFLIHRAGKPLPRAPWPVEALLASALGSIYNCTMSSSYRATASVHP